MNRFSFLNVIKFLLGILITQCATVMLVVAAYETRLEDTWIFFVLLALTISFLAALWFASIASHSRKDAVARTKQSFSREREKIRVQAEKEKHKIIKQSHQQISKEKSRMQTKASLKAKAAFAGLVGLGAVMLFTQFVTVGLLTLSTAGGALAGYLARVRQDYLSQKRNKAQLPVSEAKPIKVIKAKSTSQAIEGPIRRSN